MGWTYANKPKTQTTKDYLRAQIRGGAPASGTAQILADALIFRANDSEYYAVVRHTNPDGTTKSHFLSCVELRFARGEFNVGYKDMTDHSGPVIHRCPLKLIDMIDELDPLPEQPAPDTPLAWAKAWRAKVRAYHARRKNGPKVGQHIRFEVPLDGFDDLRPVFEVARVPGTRRTVFRWYGENYRIRGWRELPFTVINASADCQA